jgi:hypothetical protein
MHASDKKKSSHLFMGDSFLYKKPLLLFNRTLIEIVHMCLPFHNRIAIFSEKSISDIILKIDQRFSFFNRDHDPDQKTIRKNR